MGSSLSDPEACACSRVTDPSKASSPLPSRLVSLMWSPRERGRDYHRIFHSPLRESLVPVMHREHSAALLRLGWPESRLGTSMLPPSQDSRPDAEALGQQR